MAQGRGPGGILIGRAESHDCAQTNHCGREGGGSDYSELDHMLAIQLCLSQAEGLFSLLGLVN